MYINGLYPAKCTLLRVGEIVYAMPVQSQTYEFDSVYINGNIEDEYRIMYKCVLTVEYRVTYILMLGKS